MNPRINIVTPAGPDTRAYAFNEPDIGALRERPYIEPWRDRSERDYLARSHPGPSGAEQAIEQRLWDQVSGKSLPAATSQTSRLSALESLLFRQVAETGPRRHQNGDSSHFPREG